MPEPQPDATATATTATKPSKVVPLVIATAFLMENIDPTALTTAIPTIARDLATDAVHLKLALTSYLISLAVFIPASGWAAERYGAKRVFVLAIALFTIASVLCALAWSLASLVAARILQGVGGAMMTPVGRSVIIRSTDRRELIGALAWLSMPALIGPIIGPPLGGFMVTYASWHWVFLINVPIGIVGIVLASRLLPELPTSDPPFDLVGFLLSGIGLALMVVASSFVAAGEGDVIAGVLTGATSAGLLVLYWRHARAIAHPILDISLLSLQSLRTSIIGGTFFRIGIGAIPFLLPLLFQLQFGLSPLDSGLLTLASGAGALTMRMLAPRVVRRFGYRRVLVVNGIASALSVMAPALFTAAWPAAAIALVLFVTGTLRALQFTALGAFAMADVDDADASNAATLVAVGQQLAASLGVSIAAGVLQIARGGAGAPLTTASFSVAFCTVAIVAMVSVVWYWRLPASAGIQLLKR